MYMNENSHRFPALVLAAALTSAVVIGLSALAQSRATMAAPAAQVVATKPSVSQVAVEFILSSRRHFGLSSPNLYGVSYTLEAFGADCFCDGRADTCD